MSKHQKGREFLSNLKKYTDYLKWQDDKGRYETWEEACRDVLSTHLDRYGNKVQPYIDEVVQSYIDEEFLVSQRNLQFRSKQIQKHNLKLYNCSTTYAYSPDFLSKGFYVLLGGCGLGVNMKTKFTSQLPELHKRTKGTITYVVQDSIEGWADASKVLLSSYCKHTSLLKEFFGSHIRFDYSLIRPKGAVINGGFKAPGPEGLKQSLERIETLLNEYLDSTETKEFKSIIAYDILMHLSDAVLSGGVRRSACSIIIDKEDSELLNAKTGNWRKTHPWRARSNNSVCLIRDNFSKDELSKLIDFNQGDNDLGFIIVGHEDEVLNPCFEIGFNFYSKIKSKNTAVFQFCNLTEINAGATVDDKGKFDENKFYRICRNASIVGTLQAGYTKFPYLGEETTTIVEGEALLGVSITGWMNVPDLFNAEVLQKGASIVKETNIEVAKVIKINPSARTTTTKPSGNASTILKTASGIHPEHSKRYFRLMQLNKESDTAKWLEENSPDVLEESLWSATSSDYVVFVPIEHTSQVLLKDEMQGVDHLEKIKFAKQHWIDSGKTEELCYNKTTSHNISNTVIIKDMDAIKDYLFYNQQHFTAVSFLENTGDKDYTQAPFTSVLNTSEIFEKYGDGAIFMAGLIVDGLHYFNNDLWAACKYVLDREIKLQGTRTETLLQKDWLRRVKQYAKNYFKKDLKTTIYCMKDVHLWHKWNVINRSSKTVDFSEVLTKPEFTDVSTLGAIACAGGACEIDFNKK